MRSPLLFDLMPGLLPGLHWQPLGVRVTPVERHEIAGRPVLVKRDDSTAEPYGGNKVRKLEFLLAEALAGGAGRVVTAGAFGSHHALATSVYGRLAGLRVTCVLFPQPLTDHVLEVLRLIAAQGAELRFTRRMEGVPFALRRARWWHRSERACIIPPGGSNPVGSLGYVEAGLELAAQIDAGKSPEPSRIHVAAGTLGTAAGLALGLSLAGRPLPIHAVRITSPLVTNQRALRALVRGTLALLRPAGARLPSCDEVVACVTLRHDQVGDGYGRDTAAANAAGAAFAAAGMRLDGTYTAKAAAALLADEPADPPALFWHTLSSREPRTAGPPLDPAAIPQPFRDLLCD
jgi:D-cysteine desulfhydrase